MSFSLDVFHHTPYIGNSNEDKTIRKTCTPIECPLVRAMNPWMNAKRMGNTKVQIQKRNYPKWIFVQPLCCPLKAEPSRIKYAFKLYRKLCISIHKKANKQRIRETKNYLNSPEGSYRLIEWNWPKVVKRSENYLTSHFRPLHRQILDERIDSMAFCSWSIGCGYLEFFFFLFSKDISSRIIIQ